MPCILVNGLHVDVRYKCLKGANPDLLITLYALVDSRAMEPTYSSVPSHVGEYGFQHGFPAEHILVHELVDAAAAIPMATDAFAELGQNDAGGAHRQMTICCRLPLIEAHLRNH